jgi:prepilin-type N-terminal cleavage/methylation domain-containing protein
MNKIFKNEKGFSAVELLLVILVVALLSAAGWLVYEDNHKTTKAAVTSWSTTVKSNSTTSPKTTSTIMTPSTTSIIKIPQLGIEVTVPNSIKDLTYSYSPDTTGFGNNEQLLNVYLSTASLTALDPNCAASYETAIGAISEAQGTYPTDPSDQIDVGGLVRQFPNFYVTNGQESQTSCLAGPGATSDAGNLLHSQQQVVAKVFSNPSSVQLIN